MQSISVHTTYYSAPVLYNSRLLLFTFITTLLQVNKLWSDLRLLLLDTAWYLCNIRAFFKLNVQIDTWPINIYFYLSTRICTVLYTSKCNDWVTSDCIHTCLSNKLFCVKPHVHKTFKCRYTNKQHQWGTVLTWQWWLECWRTPSEWSGPAPASCSRIWFYCWIWCCKKHKFIKAYV